jgi:hypothetical protein
LSKSIKQLQQEEGLDQINEIKEILLAKVRTSKVSMTTETPGGPEKF